MKESCEALKSAHRKVRSLERQITDLESAAERAQQAADGAAAELAKHAGLPKAISAWRVNQLKKGAPTKTLPGELKTRVDAKREAETELEHARDAQQTIVGELEELRDKRDRAKQEHSTAAINALHALAEPLAQELYALNIRRAQLLQIFTGLFAMKIDDRIARNVTVSPITAVAMRMGDAFAFDAGIVPGPIDEMAARWNRRLLALLADPGAAVTVPRHVEPSDYTAGRPGAWQGPGHALPGAAVGSWKPEAA